MAAACRITSQSLEDPMMRPTTGETLRVGDPPLIATSSGEAPPDVSETL
jgi:hypothetical protein